MKVYICVTKRASIPLAPCIRATFTARFPHSLSYYIYVTVKLLSFQLILNWKFFVAAGAE
jgi:hypothetical protein